MYRIIGVDQKEYGPITADQLRQWISEGRINAASKVRREGETTWKTAAELPEFAALLTIIPPPRPPAPPMTMGVAPAAVKSNQMAVWAMITGIFSVVCCCNFVGPVSIVLGVVALSQIKNNPSQQGRGFAIAGIVLGIVALILMIVSGVVFMLNPQYLTDFQNRLNQ